MAVPCCVLPLINKLNKKLALKMEGGLITQNSHSGFTYSPAFMLVAGADSKPI
jgi:hypothetical protein